MARFASDPLIMLIRQATAVDSDAVARLHADSWRAHYRGAYRDEFLDGPVVEDRLRVWRDRLTMQAPNQMVIVAYEGDELIGFICAYGGHDKTWGSLIDNLHVRTERHRRGIGRRLIAEVAAWCRANYTGHGLYLWVLEDNRRAQRFYQGLGAIDRGGEFGEPPGGGQIHKRRYVWKVIPDIPRN